MKTTIQITRGAAVPMNSRVAPVANLRDRELPLCTTATRRLTGLMCDWLLRRSLALLLCLPLGAAAQTRFTITAHTDRGGGTSSGGTFALAGTLGQPDAGTMSGGNYSLAGGFWGASQTPASVGSVIVEARVVGDEVHLRFTGIPGRTYEIERARFVTGPWRPNNQPFAVITMPLGGVVEFVDTTGLTSTQSFYRTRLR